MSDFLTGSPVTGVVPTQSSSVTTLPDWYTNYAKDIIDQQNAVSSRGYTPYQGPRVADFTPDQQKSFDLTNSGATAAGPGFDAAISMAGGAPAAASPWFNAAGALNAPSAASPLQGQGVDYLSQSTNALGLQAAAPLISAASGGVGGNIGGYLNPYTSDVVDRLGVLAGRNLNENLLPQIQDQFTAAGQGTSGSRQGEYIGRALRDTQESLLGAQSSALQGGFSTALSAAQADAARQAGLAGTAGSLGAAQQGALQTAGQGIAGIGGTQGQLTAQQQQFLASLGVDVGNLNVNAAGTLGNLAAGKQTSALQGAQALGATGALQQSLGQKSLDTGYADYLRQQGWDQSQIDAMTNTVGALQSTMPKSVDTSATQPAGAYNPSTAATLASLGLDAAAIAKLLG
jgi:hypothetical protein